MSDINHEQMRVGLDLLRSCGANIDLYRPQIGHILDPQVGQAALDWLLLRARRAVTARIDAVRSTSTPESAVVLEEILEQDRWHDRANVDSATRALDRMELAGRERLLRARAAAADGRALGALDVLEGAEADCLSRRMRQEVAQLRDQLLSEPKVRLTWESSRKADRAERALRLYAGAQRLVAAQKYRDALSRCQEVMQDYADTPAAERAKFLADLLQSRGLTQ
jgi:hypothetical protein